mmetsp:Transcript_72329/g.157804  ORF Transcript_72329/g.157804 Transcript_72329/m.157804 type:complete len:92 (+) Transcript_72329:40-315(+)
MMSSSAPRLARKHFLVGLASQLPVNAGRVLLEGMGVLDPAGILHAEATPCGAPAAAGVRDGEVAICHPEARAGRPPEHIPPAEETPWRPGE